MTHLQHSRTRGRLLMLAAGAASTTFLASAGGAHAFTFTTQYDGNAGQEDAFLESVTLDTGEIIDQFSYVESVSIVNNDVWTGGNTGAASADKGDLATTGRAVENPTAGDIAFNLGTNNLNNIIDTEDSGSFQIDLFFNKGMDNLLIWERGKNSDLGVQALDANGDLIGSYRKINRNEWSPAGFSIDTTEIKNEQTVGSLGINFASDLGVDGPVSGVRFFSEAGFNGPDWKFVGTDAARDVPEPGLILGLGLLGGVGFWRRRFA